MPEFRKQCDIMQGYNFKKDQQTPVGYIASLKIGGTEIKADTTCKDPTNPTSDIKVVAVCSDVLWELGLTDAVYFTGQVSVFNRQVIMDLVINSMTKIDVLFKFFVYDYDPVTKAYFKVFHCNDVEMKGLLEKKQPDDLNLTIAEEASTEVQSPENYTMNIGIKPQPEAQSMTVCSSSTKNVVKSWGVKVEG